MPRSTPAIPAFGYKICVSIDHGFCLIWNWTTTRPAAHDGARLEDVLDRTNTTNDVWADTACRAAKNEAMPVKRGFVSRSHRKKPPGRPMSEHIRIANAQKSKIRRAVEHVLAHQNGSMGLIVRAIDIAHDKMKIGMANQIYNIRRFVWLRTKHAAARRRCPRKRPKPNRISGTIEKICRSNRVEQAAVERPPRRKPVTAGLRVQSQIKASI